MSECRDRIALRIVGILGDRGIVATTSDLVDDAALYGPQGCGLDSLDIAVLSTLLEQDWGRDPYSRGMFPRTLRELVTFFERPA